MMEFKRTFIKSTKITLTTRSVILIKSSYDIFANTHFFAVTENWANCASFGAKANSGGFQNHYSFFLDQK